MLLAGAGNAGAQQQALNGQEVNLYQGQFKNGLFHGVGTEHEYNESGRERAVREMNHVIWLEKKNREYRKIRSTKKSR